MTDIVISGISGAFPKCDNVEEFKDKLFAGENLVDQIDRWGPDFKNVPSKIGALNHFNRFDHTFFRINRRQVEEIGIAARMLLEKSFEAITDAGYNMKQIKGTNTGVYYAVYTNETDVFTAEKDSDFLGKTRAMIPNRISYMLDIKGPSMVVDSACSSSLHALDCAYKAIQIGDCDAAIVCGSSVYLSPYHSRSFLKKGLLDKEGHSRPFDAEAQGFVRSEAVVAIFLQKRKDARRVYSSIVHSKSNCDGFKEVGPAYPSVHGQEDLFRKFYDEINIDPRLISYVEAHATGTKVGDIVEVDALERVFCANRDNPLKIGSVKSNMGHSEACSGLCSLIKSVIAFETGFIPPHINVKTLNPNIRAFANKTVEVATEIIPCPENYIAIDSFGIGGSNAHLLISPCKKIKKTMKSQCDLPRLVTISGRTEEAINALMDALEKYRDNDEFVRLIHEIFGENTNGHIYRGYIILNEEKIQKRSLEYFPDKKRPIWFIFSGMGSQWPAMGKSLMKIPLFADSIEKSHRVLESKGINLIEVITTDDAQIFDNILNSFVGICAIQIALVDLLTAIEIKPDGIIGHSVGELGCAYADGCLTSQQTILAAYYRGLVSNETNFIDGRMAAIGAGYNDMKDVVPPEIDIACHNSSNSCTISGPTNIVKNFMEELKNRNIFAREVNTSQIAYHSRYITEAGSILMPYLQEIIPEPTLRSRKWICTSALETDWDSDKIKYLSAEYLTNNLLSPVYFEESSQYVPPNAITVEISPHGILQAILKRSFPPSVQNFPLTIRNHENNVEFLLTALGQLYEVGITPKLSNLYPPVEFPVSRSTPMISPLIKWKHDEEWEIPSFNQTKIVNGERDFKISLDEDEWEYLSGHIVSGRNVFPATGYLKLVWETMAEMLQVHCNELPVIFENVRFERATNIPAKHKNGNYTKLSDRRFYNVSSIIEYLRLHVSIQKNGNFEVSDRETTIASGMIRIPEDIDKEKIEIQQRDEIALDPQLLMKNRDFYKELRLRGYQYKGLFKKMVHCNTEGTYGEISWCDNFVTFMDIMAQMTILNVDTRDLLIPTFIRKVIIDVKKHFELLKNCNSEKPVISSRFYRNLAMSSSNGIQMIDLQARSVNLSRKKDQVNVVTETYEFLPYYSEQNMEVEMAIRVCVHIALENLPTLKMKTIELLDQPHIIDAPLYSTVITEILDDLPLIQASVNVLMNSELEFTENAPNRVTISNEKLPEDESCFIVIIRDITKKIDQLESIHRALRHGGFIIAIDAISHQTCWDDLGLTVCFSRPINNNRKIFLLRKIIHNLSVAACIKVNNLSYTWIPELQKSLQSVTTDNEIIILYSEKEPSSGILGFYNCLRKEENGKRTRCFFIMDLEAPDFSLEHSSYKNQYNKHLSHNVLKNGHWGSYRHLPNKPITESNAEHVYNSLEIRGDLSTFKWMEGSLKASQSTPEKPIIHVYYSALNFRDVMVVTGRLSMFDDITYSRLSQCYHGLECAGKDNNGVRYMGMVLNKGIASLIEMNPYMTWRVPDNMTLEEASTIIVAYATVIYSFTTNITLEEGCSVLIHAASGAVGQAAIHVCLHYKCKIFVTVGTAEKREFIKRTFPQILESRIGNSRDMSFEKLIMDQTNGRGVDVVLNSLAEDKLQASLRCVAEFGHFIEIGKFDMTKNNHLGMRPLLKSITIHSVHIDRIAMQPSSKQHQLQKLMQDWLDNGIIKPICRKVFDKNDVESAFRYMAAGKHIGKVVIKIRDEDQDRHTKPLLMSLPAEPQVTFSTTKSYVIIGGLGGFGLELTDWLIIHGARNIVLSSRNGIKNGYQFYRIKLWISYGANIAVCTEDVTNETGVMKLLQKASKLGPVAGIFNTAMILKDGTFDTQTENSFKLSAGPKAIATIHLDKLSRKMCPQLEHFVVFSSVSCGRGNAQQTNYGMSNSIMERICEIRRSDNLPGLAIQWGVIGDVGYVADLTEDNSDIILIGTHQQKITSCLKILNLFMKQSDTILSSMVVAEKQSADTDIITAVANVLGIKDLKAISMTWTFPELGLDSMMTGELKQIIEAEFDIFLTAQDLRNMSFEKLNQMKDDKAKNGKIDIRQEKIETVQEELIFNEKIINEPLLRIPFSDDKFNEEVSARNNLTVFMFPNIFAIATVMEPLAKNLSNIQSLCFQYLAEINDLDSISSRFSQFIISRLDADQEFYIIAYCLGSILALEVAKILEQQGRRGYIWFIDGSPDYVATLIEQLSADITASHDAKLQHAISITAMKMFMPSKLFDKYSNFLNNLTDWEKKKNFCVSLLREQSWSESLANRVIESMYLLLKRESAYQQFYTLHMTKGILIRSKQNIGDLKECYGLSKYFKHAVQIHYIDADHYSILAKKQTAEIIMKDPVWNII